jgi:hypothetical protein
MIKVRFKTSKWSRYQEKVFTTEDKWTDYHKWYDENTRGVILDFKIEPFDLVKFSEFPERFTDTELQLIMDYLKNDANIELRRDVIKLCNSKL